MKLSRIILFLFVLVACVLNASAQVGLVPRTGTFGSVPLVVPTGVTTNVASAAIAVYRDRGLAILPLISSTNASTSNVVFSFQVSVDATNWSTSTINVTNALSGTTGQLNYNLIPRTTLDNVRYLRLWQISHTHTASAFITNVTWSAFP